MVCAERNPHRENKQIGKVFRFFSVVFDFVIRICPFHSVCVVHFSSQNQFPTIIIDSIRTSFTRYEGKKGRKRMRFISLVLALVPVQFKKEKKFVNAHGTKFFFSCWERENENEVMWLCLDTTCKIFYNFSSARIIDGKLELVVEFGGPHRACWCSPSTVLFICLFHPHGTTYCPTSSTISLAILLNGQWMKKTELFIIRLFFRCCRIRPRIEWECFCYLFKIKNYIVCWKSDAKFKS